MRTFWAGGESELNVLSSSMEAYFDFDTREGEDPEVFGRQQRSSICVSDDAAGMRISCGAAFDSASSAPGRPTTSRAQLTSVQAAALARHALGTIAIDIPVLLAFFLLLATRPGLPRRPLMLERLNKARAKSGKVRASRTNRGLCPSSAGVQIRVRRRFRGIATIAQASPCARPSCATWQQAFLASAAPARQCTGRIHSDPHGHLALRSIEFRTSPYLPSGNSTRRSTAASSRPTVAW